MSPLATRKAPTPSAVAAPTAMALSVMPRPRELVANTHMVERNSSRARTARVSALGLLWPKALRVARPWMESSSSAAKAP